MISGTRNISPYDKFQCTLIVTHSHSYVIVVVVGGGVVVVGFVVAVGVVVVVVEAWRLELTRRSP